MRTLSALALVLVVVLGCADRDDPAAYGAPPTSAMQGPDPLVLRVPQRGGIGRVSPYARLDSVLWRSSQALPALDRTLAFDEEGGTIAFVDEKGRPARLDLRLGGVGVSRTPLTQVTSATGEAIFGLREDGTVARVTASQEWTLEPPRRARAIAPQPDGALLVLADSGDATVIWRLRPPAKRLLDTAVVPGAGARAVRTQVGDRLYVIAGRELIGLRTRDLTPTTPITLDAPITALAPTPSGDRLFVLGDSSREIAVVDRYRERRTGQIELPAQPAALRMDPLGRYLLVRMAGRDSAWVVALGTERVIGTVATAWRDDLPAVGPDGSIALVQGKDVVFVDGETLRPGRRVAGGASDLWYFFAWNGFRPRARGLDTPVEFDLPTPGTLGDSTALDSLPADSLAAEPVFPARPPAAATGASRDTARAAPRPGYYISLAALLNEENARVLAAGIEVDGRRAQVVRSVRDGTPVFRVVLGPYADRAAAERAGRATERSYWVLEGLP